VSSKAVAIAVYTLLRLALFVACWLLFQFLTPLKGIWAVVAGILVSGAISLILLDRQREKVGRAAEGFFGRINAKIDAAARAEDDDEEDDDEVAPLSQDAAQGEQQPQGKPVDEQ
jgi:hypothetical protein